MRAWRIEYGVAHQRETCHGTGPCRVGSSGLAMAARIFVSIVLAVSALAYLEKTRATAQTPTPGTLPPGISDPYIVFQSNRSGNEDIWIMNIDGSNPVQLTTNSTTDWLPEISPDGKKIAWTSNSRIWTMNIDGSNKQQLTFGSGIDQEPSWSPDGQRIVYDSTRDSSRSELYLVEVATGNLQRLTTNTAYDRKASFHPNGQQIIFERQLSGAFGGSQELYVMVLDLGGGESQITDMPGFNAGADYCPRNGRWITFSSNRTDIASPQGQIYTMDTVTGVQRQATTTTFFNLDARWSRDCAMIAFASNRHPIKYHIYLMHPSGSFQTRITNFDWDDRNPDVCCRPYLPYPLAYRLGGPHYAPTQGDPVNVAAGNMYLSEPDLSVPGTGPLLTFGRSYNNLDNETGTLGPSWRSTLDESITYTSPGSTDVLWRQADGKAALYRYESGSFLPPQGRHETLTYQGDHFEVSDPSNVTRIFDGVGRLQRVRDRRGNGFDLTRDTSGRVRDATHTVGSSMHFEYNAEGLLSEASTSLGTTVLYRYSSGMLAEAEHQGAQIWRYEYDSDFRLNGVIDPAGRRVFGSDYDFGRVVAQRDGRGNGFSFEYRDGIDLRPTDSDEVATGTARSVDPLGRALTDTWNSSGFVTRSVNQDGATVNFEYNSAGDPAHVTDAVGASWKTEYNPAGDPVSATDPTGAVTQSSYRSDHQISETTDPTGVSTNFDYDLTGTLISFDTSGPAGGAVMVPNADGTISASISPDGLVSRTEYDAFGRPVRQIDPADRSSMIVYNPDGTISATIGPDGAAGRTLYDGARRPVGFVDPLSNATLVGYDDAGNQVSAIDPLGNTTHIGYDGADNVVEVSTTIDGGVVESNAEYDPANQLISTTGPGSSGTTRYEYTPTGGIDSQTDPDGARWTYSYSPAGQLTTAVSPDDVTTTYSYDAARRLTSYQNTREGSASFAYDAAGRPISTTDHSGQIRTYQYDESGRPILSAEPAHGFGGSEPEIFAVAATLSPGGRRVGLTQGRYTQQGTSFVPRATSNVTFGYGVAGSLTEISSPELVGAGPITIFYQNVTGRPSGWAGPGFSNAVSYDLNGSTTELTWTLGSGQLAFPTRYDAAGNVSRMGSSTYSYDQLGRVTSAHDGELGDDYLYEYDLASNRTKVTKNGQVIQQISFGTADKIDTAANSAFAYDAAGRLISDTTSSGEKRRYVWDGLGQLAGIDLYSPATGRSKNIRMSYDVSGQLIESARYLDLAWPVEKLFYRYDGGRLVGEEDITGTVREYLYAGGEAPTAMRSRNLDGSYSNYFFVTNTHGDVVALTDRDGNIVNRYAYGPWGEATRVSEQVHQPFRYAGYRYEDGFNLYYLRARWMDPGTGRFLSRDSNSGSVKGPKSLNRYAYSADNPTSNIDPTGFAPEKKRREFEARERCVKAGQAVQTHPNEWWRYFLYPVFANNGVMNYNFHGYSTHPVVKSSLGVTAWAPGQWFDEVGGQEVRMLLYGRFGDPNPSYLSSQGWCAFGEAEDWAARGRPFQVFVLFHEMSHVYFDWGIPPDRNPDAEPRARKVACFLSDHALNYWSTPYGPSRGLSATAWQAWLGEGMPRTCSRNHPGD